MPVFLLTCLNLEVIVDKKYAKELFQNAWKRCQKYHSDELKSAKSFNKDTFKNMKSKKFLLNYFWVIYSETGFSALDQSFPKLHTALKNLDIAALRKMRSIKPALDAFDINKPASNTFTIIPALTHATHNFLEGAKMVADEGFVAYKKRLKKEGIDALEELPGIYSTTQNRFTGIRWSFLEELTSIDSSTKSRLAKNIGLADTAKPDKWLERAARQCKAASVDELVDYLSEEFDASHHVVDVVLWRSGVKERPSLYD